MNNDSFMSGLLELFGDKEVSILIRMLAVALCILLVIACTIGWLQFAYECWWAWLLVNASFGGTYFICKWLEKRT